MNIEKLPNGKTLATDERGISKTFKTVEEAQKWLWDKDEPSKTVKKYRHDVSRKISADLYADPIYYEWLTLIECGTPEEIDQFIYDHPLFVSQYLSAYEEEAEEREGKRASYDTVKEKGMGFIWDDSVYINICDRGKISGLVDGYTSIYHTFVSKKARLTKNNDPSEGLWFCDCQWGTWCNSGHRPHDGPDSTGSVKIQNRFCSHAYAMYKLLHDGELRDLYLTPSTGRVLF